MKEIVDRYTRGEAGVRGLERKIGSVVRAKVVEWSDWTESRKEGDTSLTSYNPVVEQHDIERILGIAPWDASLGLAGEDGLEGRAGLVYGLVVMGQGEGGILPVETVMVPGKGVLRLTGMLGDVSFSLSSSTHSF
jgi:ATP-dependent Lon protease